MRYHNITKDDMLNGSGLRVVLWVAGCAHHCQGCHNPITHNPNGGIPFDENTKKEIFKELEKDYIDGITFSGGDPLHPANIEEIGKLIVEITNEFPNKTKWLYTGYKWEDIKELPFIKYLTVVCDGKFELDKLSPEKHWVGSSNQRVIDVKKSLHSDKIFIWEE